MVKIEAFILCIWVNIFWVSFIKRCLKLGFTLTTTPQNCSINVSDEGSSADASGEFLWHLCDLNSRQWRHAVTAFGNS